MPTVVGGLFPSASGLYPSSSGLYPSTSAYVGVQVLRELPPSRLSIAIETPDGNNFRWANDDPAPENVPANLTFTTTMPGGFEQMSATLPRKPGVDYADLAAFSTITAFGVGEQVAWQGRLETTPRTSGDQMTVTPGAFGWQAHLNDDQSARMIYIDNSLSKWQGPSVQRQLNRQTALQDADTGTAVTDTTTGYPSLQCQMTGPWTRTHATEAWYDALGLPISMLYYAWKLGAGGTLGDSDYTNTGWAWTAALSSDDAASVTDRTANLRAIGPGTGSITATGTRNFAEVQLVFTGAGGNSGVNYPLAWTYLAVIGQHTVPIRGTLTATGGLGVFASDIVQHAVTTWAPKLTTSKAGLSTIEATSFIIPQLAFTDPTTAGAIIINTLSYQALMDWWVDEGPTFNLASRANHGRNWRARVGPSGLQETGPQVAQMFNGVIVSYNDVTGVARTVGPSGSGANTIDASLADTDPTNPVNVAGINRPYEYPNIGTSTAAAAIAVGQRWLLEQKQASTSGQASIVGHVQDDHGVWWPAWAIRAGDWITFIDAHDTTARRIVKTSYSDASRTCQLDLDSPPTDMDALLARMSAAVAALGFK